MKKERLIKLVIAFALLFLLIFLCVRFLSKGYTNSYKIKNKFKINEVYTKDEVNERNNYYITIEVNDLVFDYQFYRELENNNKIVKDVLYYDGEYKCMMPIFKNDLKVDFHCYKDNVFYNYIDVVGKDEELDKYIKSLSKDIYDINMFKDNTSDSKEKERIKYYEKNIPNNYIISLTTEDKQSLDDILIEKIKPKAINNKECNDIIIDGNTNILYTLAKCCRPIKGDEIIGFITKGEGIKVHKKDCPNISNSKERIIDISWNEKANNTYYANLNILVNRNNFLADLIALATKEKIIITELKNKDTDNGIICELLIKVNNKDELDRFKSKVNKFKNVKVME